MGGMGGDGETIWGMKGGRMGKFYWGKTETWQRGIEGVNVWGLQI